MSYIEVKKIIKQVSIGFFELFFPQAEVCPICHQETSCRGMIGKNCLGRISLVAEPFCNKCGRPLRLEEQAARLCRQCRENNYYFSEARAVGVYEGALREYLTELKYRYRPDLGIALGRLLVEWVKIHRDYQKFDLIIPIPIHRQKLELRGYNQAELLAKPLQKYLGIELKNDIIIRDKITESQNALGKTERFMNIAGAFRVINSEKLKGARVLLADDILTTGATAAEASRILLRAGALNVKVLTLAVGVIDNEWFHQ